MLAGGEGIAGDRWKVVGESDWIKEKKGSEGKIRSEGE